MFLIVDAAITIPSSKLFICIKAFPMLYDFWSLGDSLSLSRDGEAGTVGGSQQLALPYSHLKVDQ